jgi:hypothetical protein
MEGRKDEKECYQGKNKVRKVGRKEQRKERVQERKKRNDGR